MGVLQVQQSWTAHLLLDHILSRSTGSEPNKCIEDVRHNLRGGRKESIAEGHAAKVLPTSGSWKMQGGRMPIRNRMRGDKPLVEIH